MAAVPWFAIKGMANVQFNRKAVYIDREQRELIKRTAQGEYRTLEPRKYILQLYLFILQALFHQFSNVFLF